MATVGGLSPYKLYQFFRISETKAHHKAHCQIHLRITFDYYGKRSYCKRSSSQKYH